MPALGHLFTPPAAATIPEPVLALLAAPKTIGGVLRRGIRVRCRASGAGRCRVAASVRKRRVASGSKRLRAGRSAVVAARLNRRGRRVARRALRARRRVAVRLRVTLPGAPAQRRRVTLVPR